MWVLPCLNFEWQLRKGLLAMSSPKKTEIKDEPGAEDRFLRGVRKALTTPPKPHKDEPKRNKGGKLKPKT